MPREESVFYTCPNKCADAFFYQNGLLEVNRQITETGELIEDDSCDFTPRGPVKCRKCGAKAKVGKKVTTTTIEITEE